MAKLTASEVLYMDDGGLKRCGRCMMFLRDIGACTIHDAGAFGAVATRLGLRPADLVCGLYVHGPTTTVDEHGKPMKAVAPKESGLGRGNTSCGNCRYGANRKTCEHPCLAGFAIDVHGGCCNAWTESS